VGQKEDFEAVEKKAFATGASFWSIMNIQERHIKK
jgi:argininosuccinate synthase